MSGLIDISITCDVMKQRCRNMRPDSRGNEPCIAAFGRWKLEWWRGLLCCVLLCYVLLCFVVLCFVVFCCVVFCCVVFCCVLLCFVLCFVLCCVVFCCVSRTAADRNVACHGREIGGKCPTDQDIASLLILLT